MAYDDFLAARFKTSPEEEARLKEQAKNFPVTRLPYHGPRRNVRSSQFDQRVRMVSAETGLTFSDVQRIHVDHRSDGSARWVPEFANNEKDLRLVLAQSAWNYMLKPGRVPDEFAANLGDLKQWRRRTSSGIKPRSLGKPLAVA
jgi:hypothetical protein